jgi:hypothetical protein
LAAAFFCLWYVVVCSPVQVLTHSCISAQLHVWLTLGFSKTMPSCFLCRRFSGGTGSTGDTLPSCSNNAAVLGACEGARSDGGGALQSMWDVSSHCAAAAEHIGAVVAKAWPGRQRGFQPTSILVAGVHTSTTE